MEGITNVVQGAGFIRVEMEADFYVAMNSGGILVAIEDGYPATNGIPGEADSHAHLDWPAAEQLALTILSARAIFDQTG